MISIRVSIIASALGVIAGGCTSEDEPSSPETSSVVAGDPTSSNTGTTNPANTPGGIPTPAPMPPPLTGMGGSPDMPGAAGSPAVPPPRPTAIVPPVSTPGGSPTANEPPTSTGGSGAGGTAGDGGLESGGAPPSGGAAGDTQGAAGGGDIPADGPLPMGNPPVSSEGCGATTVTSGKYTISSSGEDRSYIIDIPDDYDPNTPHRLFYTSHWIGSTSEAVRDQNYYFLKPLAEEANEPSIFVAPQSDGQTWQEKDHALFDDLLAYVKENLCIDTTRVFATGFSFGGMITYSLSVNHQKDIRAAVGIAPANYNIFVPEKTHEPIAWMQTTGMGDGTCPWVNGGSDTQGAKYIAMEHATDNGCTVPDDIPTWQNGDHVCYDFEGCPAEFPVKACTFAGGHTNIDNEGNVNWIAQESWDFFMQF